MTKLVIVESPSKAKTIANYLGKEYIVKASIGHIRDLPKQLGVDIDHDFQEEYEIPENKTKVVAELKLAAKRATKIILATDPDREGEAISWHLLEAIKPPKSIPVDRVLFQEITPAGIEKAMANPTTINKKLVDAQRARRVLDRLVGYKVSQILWSKVRRGLSAGRVQSVAVRLIVEKERERISFVPIEYWTIEGLFATEAPPSFSMKLVKIANIPVQLGNKETKCRIDSEDYAHRLKIMILKAVWNVTNIKTKTKKRNPPTPFTTAKLQQESAHKLNMNVTRTMQTAQSLYEGLDLGEGPVGLITYMRTDSSRISNEAIANIREFILNEYGANLLPKKPPVYKNRTGAQDAHEAIRPTNILRTPDSLKGYLTTDQLRLYAMIWRRTVASQMESAVFDEKTIESSSIIESKEEVLFQTKNIIERFPGWLLVYSVKQGNADCLEDAVGLITSDDEAGLSNNLPSLHVGQTLIIKDLIAKQNFTKPPSQFSEATLVKELEEDGIGRPSTYANIISTIQGRDYVKKVDGQFKPTELGCLVTDLLKKGFQQLMDPSYTSKLENELDRIEDGELTFVNAMKNFYEPFEKALLSANDNIDNLKTGIASDKLCKQCNAPMLKRIGKNGVFFGCSRYPSCNNTEEIEHTEDQKGTIECCPVCGATPMVLKKGKFGLFLACLNYPNCKGVKKISKSGSVIQPDTKLDEQCSVCGKYYVKRYGMYGEFICCVDYPKCKTVKKEILAVSCPKCGNNLTPIKTRFGKVFYGCTHYPKCNFSIWDKPIPRSCPTCKNKYMLEKIRKSRGKEPITLLLCPSCSYEEIMNE